MLVTSATLWGCSPKMIEDYVSDADEFSSRDRHQEASIVLKKGITEFPKSAKLREQLADSLIKTGDIAGATQAYSVSLEIEYSERVAIRLFELLRLQEQNESIIEIYEETANKHQENVGDLSLYYAIALFKENKLIKSNIVLRKIEEKSNISSYEKDLASAFLNWYRGNSEAALEFFEDAQKQKPDSYDAALGIATVSLATQDYEHAVKAIETLLDKQEAGNIPRILLAHSYLNLGFLEKAGTQITILKKRIPESLPYLVLTATHDFLSDDFEQSKINSEKALLLDSENIIARKVAVVSNYKLNNYEQAYNFLTPIISSEEHISNSILNMGIELKSQMGLFDDEFDGYLSELTSIDDEMYGSYADVGINALALGRESLSRKISEMLRDIELKNIDDETARKLTALHSNFDSQLALTLAKAIYKKNDTFESLETYTTLLAKTSNLEESLDYVQNASGKYSETTLLELKFRLFVIGGDEEGLNNVAKTLFDKDNGNIMANAYFFGKASSNGRLADAIYYCNELEKNESTPIDILYRCFSFLHLESAEESERLASRIKKAFESAPSSSKYLSYYIKTLIDKKALQEIISVLTLRVLQDNNKDMLWQAKIDSLSLLNKPDEIELTFKKWKNSNPNSKRAWQKQITYLENIGELNKALETLSNFETKFGTTDLTKILRVHFLLSSNKVKSASEAFETLPNYLHDTSPWLGLQGRIFLANDKYDLALSSLSRAYSTNSTSRNTGALIAAYLSKGDYQALESFLVSHLQNNPHDSKARTILVNYYLQTSSEKALPFLSKNIEENPYDLDSINNYAWLLNTAGENTKALSLSEILLKFSEDPNHFHTVAIIYESNGMIEKSIDMFERMMELAPSEELTSAYAEFIKRNNLNQ